MTSPTAPARAARPDLSRRRAEMTALQRLEQVHSRIQQHLARGFAERGLDVTPAQAGALAGLFELRETTTSRLAQHLGLADVTVGRFVTALVDAGYVARRRNPADAREQLLSPTEHAHAALPDFVALNNQVLDALFGDLDDATLRLLTERLAEAAVRLGGRAPGTGSRLLPPGGSDAAAPPPT